MGHLETSEADASTASGLVSRAPQLFAVLPPWPNSTCTSHPSHPSHPPLHPPSQPSDMSKLAPAMAALNRSGDALDLLGEANDDAKRLEVLALPIAALVLLELASAMLRVGLMLRDAQRCSEMLRDAQILVQVFGALLEVLLRLDNRQQMH